MNTHNNLASIVARNNAGEQSAIQEYLELLTIPGLPKELIDDIHEIISDEMNHSMKLSNWVERLTGIMPAKD